MSKFFGTDGIRGIYNITLTDMMAYNIGNAIATLKEGALIVIGRDTRLSGKNLSNNLIKGAIDGGARAVDAGIIPTPAIAYTTRLIKADYGVVISASHNPPEYNGIKVFDSMGRKLSDSDKERIEYNLRNKIIVKSDALGTLIEGEDYSQIYIQGVCDKIGISLEGLTVALDCADGAAFKVAPEIFRRLGAKVITYNALGDGSLINCNSGALHPNSVASKVRELNLDVGFSFDGDADRVIAVDASGNIIDGDLIIYMISNYLKKHNKLKGDTVVGTHHTNLGVEKALFSKGIKLKRTNIGDQHVAHEMIENNYSLGGEQSGHIIMRDFLDTGDGIWAAVYLMKIMAEENKPLKELTRVTKTPQVNINVVVKDNEAALSDPDFIIACDKARQDLMGRGRLLIRASGTEPKVRIMVESNCVKEAETIGLRLEKIVKGEI